MGMITDDQMIPKIFEVAWEVTGGVCCSEFHIPWRWSILKRPWKFDKHINQRQVLLFNEWKRRRCVKMWLAGRGRWPAQPHQSSVGHQTTTIIKNENYTPQHLENNWKQKLKKHKLSGHIHQTIPFGWKNFCRCCFIRFLTEKWWIIYLRQWLLHNMKTCKQTFQLFGAFLAWETRNVQIPALNDSK